MPYVSTHYSNNASAPVGRWTCAPTSKLAPFDKAPTGSVTSGVDLCGQCVSYVKRVCPTLPLTGQWRKGAPVKGNATIVAGTVIATFNAAGKYDGHAAIYVSQTKGGGILVYDQFVTPPTPQPVRQRRLRWGAHGRSNNGDNFYVVE
ncbi:Uncharacterised protein [Burkholderia pseudomallei]|uniref:BPSL0067 family protein n=1 Tax=Burkholderia pseudomallei TaxID=28450 RepID=UPI000975676B|nr:BPSL0067 family protein [Burkholderia pseudomallei]MBF3569196.1 BPSL0067 family protein [Burkholderia pseudomallei]ONE95469.1 hypothetical protein AQ960_12025 [Burkholderia pseudomallei]CAJ4170216.1 Uncharacterised protein [Burkholderia pseudomallei]CAJ4332066.1 Uncharacterised protein [Burkholderia pseudomallei]CAJ6666530.1 Uncharacterised protein [Burkholderia pseudomallei]